MTRPESPGYAHRARRLEMAGLAIAATGLAVWWLVGSMEGRPPAGLYILAAGLALGVALPGRAGSLAVLLAAGLVAQRLIRLQLPELSGSAGIGIAVARGIEAAGLLITLTGAARRLAAPAALPAIGRSLQVAGLLGLSAVGAELLSAYDDSTGQVGALLFAVVFFGALYGAPALLMREIARRARWGWSSIVLMAFAAGILQAGVIDQSLFSADYRGLDDWAGSRQATFVAPLGTSAHMALNFVLGHVIYSFCAPIAVAEAWRPEQAGRPWLRLPGTAVAGAAYLAAAGLIMADPESQSASALQVALALLAATACAGAAAWVGRRTGQDDADAGRAPGLGTTLIGALALAIGFSVLPETWTGVWLGVAGTALLATAVARLSRRAGWGVPHAAAVALAFLLCRGLLAFTYFPLLGEVSAARKYSHNVVMLALVCLAGWLALRTSRGPQGREPLWLERHEDADGLAIEGHHDGIHRSLQAKAGAGGRPAQERDVIPIQRDPVRGDERVRPGAGLEFAQPDVGRIGECQVAGERLGRLVALDVAGHRFRLGDDDVQRKTAVGDEHAAVSEPDGSRPGGFRQHGRRVRRLHRLRRGDGDDGGCHQGCDEPRSHHAGSLSHGDPRGSPKASGLPRGPVEKRYAGNSPRRRSSSSRSA